MRPRATRREWRRPGRCFADRPGPRRVCSSAYGRTRPDRELPERAAGHRRLPRWDAGGMQVPGAARVRRVATGVSASLELFQRAAQDGADMLIVHHGLFFGSGPRPPLSDQDRDRLKTLFDHDITLAGYHLALDAHPQVGNNAIICDRLGVAKREPFGEHGAHTLGFVGALDGPLSIAQLVERVERQIGPGPLVLGRGPDSIERVAVIK